MKEKGKIGHYRNNSPLSTRRSESRMNTGAAASGEFAQLSTNSPLFLHAPTKITASSNHSLQFVQNSRRARSKSQQNVLGLLPKHAEFLGVVF